MTEVGNHAPWKVSNVTKSKSRYQKEQVASIANGFPKGKGFNVQEKGGEWFDVGGMYMGKV